MVGLIPLFAVEVLDQELFDSMPEFTKRLQWFLLNRPDLANLISRWTEKRKGERHLLSLLRGHRMKKLLKRMLDESEFLSSYGIRALSRQHLTILISYMPMVTNLSSSIRQARVILRFLEEIPIGVDQFGFPSTFSSLSPLNVFITIMEMISR